MAHNAFKLSLIAALWMNHEWAKAESVDPIRSMISSLLEWAPACDGSISKENCDDEQSTLWNGLLCSMNSYKYDRECTAVKAAQGADGRMWRSPRRVGIQVDNSFSRLMALGVLLYLAETRDIELAARWAEYLERERGLCPGGVFSSCAINGRLNEAISEVYRYLDLNDYVPSTINQNSPDTLGWILEAQTTATGESLHYLALQLLVRKKIGIWTNDMQSAANIIADRQTQNLFFMWLSQGKTHGLCNRVLGLAPVTKPARHLNWTWEHSDRERSWRESMGWDFIYLGEACLK